MSKLGQKRSPRKCPTAYPGSQARGVGTDRTVALSTGRGDSRLTPAEARTLAAELLAAAEAGAAGENGRPTTNPGGVTMSATETTTPAARPPARQVLKFNTIADVMLAADYVFMSGNLPAGCDNKFKVFVMLLAGMEVGFGVSQSMAWITPPVNGRCSIFGDGGLALIRASGQLEVFAERIEGTGDDRTAVCTVKRRGYPERAFTYTMGLAKKLKSYKVAHAKGGPWADDPDNMLQWRARWRAFRTEFTDVLGGMIGAEEAEDYVTVDAVVVNTTPAALPASPPAPPALPAVSDAQFAEFARLRQLVRDAHDGDGSAEWKAHLQPFGADSVKALTAEQAAQFVTAVGRQYDPFTYPPPSPPA